MGRISFENFGNRAQMLKNFTSISGRYPYQNKAEKLIIDDIIKKLEINSNDTCLDIGCGAGNILIPLLPLVKEITGIDHEKIIQILKSRLSNSSKIKLISGNFLDISIKDTFNKIIVYSVIHYLKNESEVFKFINKSLTLLAPGGKVLYGDIPNTSKKERFLASEQGKEFTKEWEQKIQEYKKNHKDESSILEELPADNNLVVFNDEVLLKIIETLRDSGYNAYIVPQPPDLPFGYTREDILIEKPK